MTSQLTHPELMTVLGATHFNATVKFQNGTTTYDAANEPTQTYADDLVLIDIKAYIEPMLGGGTTASGEENRASNQTIVAEMFNVSLAGYYPTITNGMQMVDASGRAYNVIAMAFDDTLTTTWLVCQRINLIT